MPRQSDPVVIAGHRADRLEGGLATPVLQAVGFAFLIFGTAFGAFTDKDNRIPVYGVVLSVLLPLPVVVGVLIMGLQ